MTPGPRRSWRQQHKELNCCFIFFFFFGCAARGILVPQPRTEIMLSPVVEVRSLNHWTTREVLKLNCFCCWERTLPTLKKLETNTTITPPPILCNTSISPHPSFLPPDISAGPLEFHSRPSKHTEKGRQELFPRPCSLQAPWLSTLSLKQREQHTLLTSAGPSWEETVSGGYSSCSSKHS